MHFECKFCILNVNFHFPGFLILTALLNMKTTILVKNFS